MFPYGLSLTYHRDTHPWGDVGGWVLRVPGRVWYSVLGVEVWPSPPGGTP